MGVLARSRNVKKPDYRLYSEQLLAFMDYLGLQRAHLIGHSLGGGASSLHKIIKIVLISWFWLRAPVCR